MTTLVDPLLSYLDTEDVSSVNDELVGQLGVVGQVVLQLLRVADVACAQNFFIGQSLKVQISVPDLVKSLSFYI